MKLSVIVPCYNAENWIGATLTSLLIQDRPPDEIIVADNGSDDGSRTVAASFGAAVRVLDVPQAGANRARIAGFDAAKGDALMFCDADDVIGPETLGALEEALIRNPGSIACCPWFRYELSNEAWHVAPASCTPRTRDQDDLSAWLTGWYQPPCSVLWSRTAYARSGGWDPDLALNQDGDVMMRGLVAGNRLVRVSSGAAFYRRMPGDAATVSSRRNTPAGLAARVAVLERIARAIDRAGAMRRYAGPLHEAFAGVAADLPPDAIQLRSRLSAACARFRSARPAAYELRRATALAEERSGRFFPVGVARGMPPPQILEATVGRLTSSVLPLVSVVIPAFNRAETIERCLSSVMAQTYKALEVIVVDDASTDGTAAVAASIDDPRVRVVKLDRNRGAAAARNRGIATARGDLFAFCDSDDFWSPDKLARQVAVMQAGGPQLGLVYCSLRSVGEDGTERIDEAMYAGRVFDALLVRNIVTGGGTTVLVRRTALDLVGGFDTSLPAIEDYDLWLRIARFFAFDFVAEPLATYMDNAADACGLVRVSRNERANARARDRMFALHEPILHRSGVDHLFLLDSARRVADQSERSLFAVLKPALKAWARRPFTPYFYRWVATDLLSKFLRFRA